MVCSLSPASHSKSSTQPFREVIITSANHAQQILNFILLDLCSHPEYIELLRKELASQETLDYNTISSLPILDSFIKESVRLNPADEMGLRRKALKPFTFSNGGPHVPEGQIACLPAAEILTNPAKYPNPQQFDGLRFLKPSANVQTEESDSKLTDVSKDFPVWGFGSKACPGRWHAALVLKLSIVHLVQNYDFKLENPTARKKWFWETFQMPYESTKVLFRNRVAQRSN